MDLIGITITLAVVLFSTVVHEVSHGLMAEHLGDNTARDEGRITLNPISHIDLYGTIILPAMMYFAQIGFTSHPIVFGSAKPVPVNFLRLNRYRNIRFGAALVSFAGPLSNFVLATIFALIIKLGLANSISEPILLLGIYINLSLGVFNLIPIPPLDGSKILFSFLPYERWFLKVLEYERFGFILIFVFLYTGILGSIISPVINGFFNFFGI